MKTRAIHLDDLVDAGKPERVLEEVRETLTGILTDIDLQRLEQVFVDVKRLFAGTFPGYAGCSTRYHDLEHTTDAFLAMARILHGAVEKDRSLDRRTILLGLISALLHDTGYIKREDDRAGSGAKYTASHVLRGIDFSREYLLPRGYSPEDCEVCRSVILSTGLDIGIGRIAFRSKSDAQVGRMLGTCDLVAQTARRSYLEKLPYLYRELVEGGVLRHGSERRFIEDTAPFCRSVLDRIANELDGEFRYLREHFRVRWGIDRNLYIEAIEENISGLESVLRSHPGEYRLWLKREIPGKYHLTPPVSIATEAHLLRQRQDEGGLNPGRDNQEREHDGEVSPEGMLYVKSQNG